MPCSRAGHELSAHNVPTTASANNASGSAQAGRASERNSSRRSSVGTSATNQSTMKMATADVDHGSEAATSTASRSTVRIRATGSRQLLEQALNQAATMPGRTAEFDTLALISVALLSLMTL